MTVRYFYLCDLCGHDYMEQREETEQQYFVTCNSCGNGSYQLKEQVQVEEPVEVLPAPEIPVDIPIDPAI